LTLPKAKNVTHKTDFIAMPWKGQQGEKEFLTASQNAANQSETKGKLS